MSTVTIGCKQPNGILMSATLNGKLVEKRINGWNQSKIEGGHGITHDVPADLWGAWLNQYKESKLVKGGFIFAHGSEKDVKAESKEKVANKSKLEQMPQITGEAKEGGLGKADNK